MHLPSLSVAIAGLAVAGGSSLHAQAGIVDFADTQGECRAEIDQQPEPCLPFNIYTAFASGRAIFIFGGVGRGYSFEGKQLPARDPTSFTVAIDTVAIGSPGPVQNLVDMDGTCTVQTVAGTGRFTSIVCDAIGGSRKTTYRFTLEHVTDSIRERTP
jgi:hypothetical protein